MFHNARRLHSGTNCCCTQKSEGGERKNSHTIRLEKHHVPNRTLLLLLLLRPDGVYNITPGFSVKLNFVFPFSRMGNWSIRLLSFVWVLIGVIIISRTDHAGMRGGGDVWHFKTTKKEAPGSFTTLVGSKELAAIHFVCLSCSSSKKMLRERHPKGAPWLD
jgi:hypothetical protein